MSHCQKLIVPLRPLKKIDFYNRKLIKTKDNYGLWIIKNRSIISADD